MRTAALVLVLAFAGCSAATGSNSRGSPSAAASPSTAVLSSCRLPFTTFTATGFIGVPDGIFTADTGSATEPDPSHPGFVRTVAFASTVRPGGNR